MEEQLAPPLNKTLKNMRNYLFNIPITPYTNIKKIIRYLEYLGSIATTRPTPQNENSNFSDMGYTISKPASDFFGVFI